LFFLEKAETVPGKGRTAFLARAAELNVERYQNKKERDVLIFSPSSIPERDEALRRFGIFFVRPQLDEVKMVAPFLPSAATGSGF